MHTTRWWAARAFLATFITVAALSIPSAAIAGPDADIHVVGGDRVISDEVLSHLDSCTAGDVIRLSGPNRYATASAVSQEAFATADVVYLAVGTNFPDALAAGPVAALRDAPILLLQPDSVPAETTSELTRLDPTEIVILGGKGAISGSVEASLEAHHQAAVVTRIGGIDRFDTAALVSASYFDPGLTTAFVATGENFPDALAGGVLAAQEGGPVLLTASDGLPSATKRELERLAPDEIVVLGGSSVVSDAVLLELETYAISGVRRIAGPNRFETAAAISREVLGSAAVYVATALDFPDALAATPSAVEGPLLLAVDDELPAPTVGAIMDVTGLPCEPFVEPAGPVLAIGDSVMAGASTAYAPVPNLESEIAELTVNASVSRQFLNAKSIVSAALSSATPPETIVIHLGTNGPATSGQFADLMSVAGETRMLFLTVKLEKSWESVTNSVIRANVPLYENAELVDWWALADSHPDWFSRDVNCGCHLWKSAARQGYIGLIGSAIGG